MLNMFFGCLEGERISVRAVVSVEYVALYIYNIVSFRIEDDKAENIFKK